MRCLVVLIFVAVCFAEPPTKENSSAENKDKRGAVSYEHGDHYHGHSAAIALPATSLGYGGLGHSPLLLSGGGLGLLGHSSLGHSYGLASPLSLGAIGGHGLGHSLGHGYALSAQPIVLGHGYAAAPALGGFGYGGLGALSLGSFGSAIPASSLKLSSSPLLSHGISSLSLDSLNSHDHSYHGASLTPPSKSYGVPSSGSYSSGFQPSNSGFSSYSGSSSYSSPSSSYGAPSSSYGPPSSSYGVPSVSSSHSDYSTLPYSSGSQHSSRDYRSH